MRLRLDVSQKSSNSLKNQIRRIDVTLRRYENPDKGNQSLFRKSTDRSESTTRYLQHNGPPTLSSFVFSFFTKGGSRKTWSP